MFGMIVSTIAVLISVSFAALPPEIEADRLLKLAAQQIESGKYSDAIVSFNSVFTLGVALPPKMEYHYSKCFANNKRWSEAKVHIEKYFNLVGKKGENYSEALDLYNRIINEPVEDSINAQIEKTLANYDIWETWLIGFDKDASNCREGWAMMSKAQDGINRPVNWIEVSKKGDALRIKGQNDYYNRRTKYQGDDAYKTKICTFYTGGSVAGPKSYVYASIRVVITGKLVFEIEQGPMDNCIGIRDKLESAMREAVK